MCYNPPLIRDKPLGAPAFMKLVYSVISWEFDRQKAINWTIDNPVHCNIFMHHHGSILLTWINFNPHMDK